MDDDDGVFLIDVADAATMEDILDSIVIACENYSSFAAFRGIVDTISTLMDREKARDALALLMSQLPPEEIDILRSKLERSGKLFPMAESLFAWVMELHKTPPEEITDELLHGLTFLAKRVNSELEKLNGEKP